VVAEGDSHVFFSVLSCLIWLWLSFFLFYRGMRLERMICAAMRGCRMIVSYGEEEGVKAEDGDEAEAV